MKTGNKHPTPEEKEAIFERDDYRCQFCGMGRREGLELDIVYMSFFEDFALTFCKKHAAMMHGIDDDDSDIISQGETLCKNCYELRRKNKRTSS